MVTSLVGMTLTCVVPWLPIGIACHSRLVTIVLPPIHVVVAVVVPVRLLVGPASGDFPTDPPSVYPLTAQCSTHSSRSLALFYVHSGVIHIFVGNILTH